ncbi:MAG: MFS transporter [Streptomyces sp.]|nr:MFS transporter [Streptomyces sp.]NUQ98635.1 MFS transporter [Streptomyces sp.]
MTANEASTHARIPSDLAARLDRLPWNGLHTTILVALGAGWLFDSLEVQLFGSAVGPLGAYFGASVFQQDAILAIWLTGILLGALAGGHLADRYGRRRLFVLTLLWYAGFTVLTGLSPTLGFVYGFRFLAALGVGAEYAIVNAAIAELMPARVRGRVGAVVMNFWAAGAVLAGLLAYLLLNTLALDDAISWRYLFAVGGLLALVVLYFRCRIPESPRWLASQGRYKEAEAVVAGLEERSGLTPEVGHGTEDVQRVPAPGLRQALGELLRLHRGRLALGAVLDLAEAFGYYGIFALLSVVVLKQVHIGHAQVPFFFIVGNVGALVGGLAMSLVFDRLGRHRTVAFSYTLAAAGVGLLAWATASGSALWVTLAFVTANAFATAAWTSAYPTFTELFPTHLRGAGVGFSVAVGRIGAIVGTLALPDLATRMGATASYLLVVACWLAGVAAIGVFRLRGGIDAAARPLESLNPTPA